MLPEVQPDPQSDHHVKARLSSLRGGGESRAAGGREPRSRDHRRGRHHAGPGVTRKIPRTDPCRPRRWRGKIPLHSRSRRAGTAVLRFIVAENSGLVRAIMTLPTETAPTDAAGKPLREA